jgi:CRISPR-associated protein Csx16
MTIWIVSRHQGAVRWLQRRGVTADCVVPHLLTELVKKGDTVYGVLPLHAIADIVEKGAVFYALDFSVSADKRGRELTDEELDAMDCRIQKYLVYRD